MQFDPQSTTIVSRQDIQIDVIGTRPGKGVPRKRRELRGVTKRGSICSGANEKSTGHTWTKKDGVKQCSTGDNRHSCVDSGGFVLSAHGKALLNPFNTNHYLGKRKSMNTNKINGYLIQNGICRGPQCNGQRIQGDF